jgi:hypothetical protein
MNDDVLERWMLMSRSLHLSEVEQQLVPVLQRTRYPFTVERYDPPIIIIRKKRENILPVPGHRSSN